MLARPIALAIVLLLGVGLILVCLPWSFMQFNQATQARRSLRNLVAILLLSVMRLRTVKTVRTGASTLSAPVMVNAAVITVVRRQVFTGMCMSRCEHYNTVLCFGLIAGACGGYTFLPVKLALVCDNCISQGWFYLLWLWQELLKSFVLSLTLVCSLALIWRCHRQHVLYQRHCSHTTHVDLRLDLFLQFSASTAAQF